MSIISEQINGKKITVKITSSNLVEAIYDSEVKELSVVFKNGSIYIYNEVPWSTFAQLRLAESQGKFFNTEIKNVYTHKKQDEKTIVS